MNSLDHQLAESKGFTILEDAEAQNHMTSSTLLFSIGFEWMIIQSCFEIAYPAIFIGGDLSRSHRGNLIHQDDASEEEKQAADLEHANEGQREYERIYKPFHDNWCSTEILRPPHKRYTRIYWREHKGPGAGDMFD